MYPSANATSTAAELVDLRSLAAKPKGTRLKAVGTTFEHLSRLAQYLVVSLCYRLPNEWVRKILLVNYHPPLEGPGFVKCLNLPV
jgi:hypothetical protein